VTSRKIREAFSPPGSPVGGSGGEYSNGYYDDQVISDEDDEEEEEEEVDGNAEDNARDGEEACGGEGGVLQG